MNQAEREARHQAELRGIADFLATFEQPYRPHNPSKFQQVRRGATAMEISEAVGLSEATARTRLGELEDQGLVVRSRENRDSWWRYYWYHARWSDHAGRHSWAIEAAMDAQDADRPGPRQATSLVPTGPRAPARFLGGMTHTRPMVIDVRVTYTPREGWEALLVKDGATVHGPFGRGATAGLAVATLVEVAAHLLWREGGLMGHWIDTLFGLVILNQVLHAGRWLWRQYLLWRAPMRHDLADALQWSRLHGGDLARFPGGDASLAVTRSGEAKVVVNRQRRR